MQNGAKIAVRLIAGILVLALVAGLVVMAVSAAEDDSFAAGASNYQLTADVDGIVIDHDLLLDLNGYDATNVTVNEGVTLQLVDSANDSYDAEACGSLSGTIHGTVEQLVQYDAKNYLVICQDGVYSAHRFYAGISSITLVTGNVSLGYKATFLADSVINAMVSSYGYCLSVNDYAAKEKLQYGAIEKSEMTLLLKNILSENASVSKIGATATIYGNAIIAFNLEDSVVEFQGNVHDITLREAVEAVNETLHNDRNAYSAAQVEAVRNMYNTYADYMTDWSVDAILTEDKFVAKEAAAVYDQTLTLGQLFAAAEGANIGEVAVTIEGVEATYAANADWTQSTITFNGIGTATITITDNDLCWAATNTVEIGKADIAAPAVDTLNATYGQTLSAITLPEGFSWVDDSASVGNVGTNSFAAIYDAGENYNTVEVTVTVEVAKADITAPAVDTLNATYGQTLSEITLPEGFSWEDDSASVGNAGTQTHTAIYNAGENYNPVKVTVTVEVAKADIAAPAVEPLNATYGQTLAEIALPKGFTWVDAAASVGNAGTNSFTAIYNAGENYNTVDVTVTVEVAKIDPTYTMPANLEATEGDALSTIELPTGFAWVNGDEIVTLEKTEYAATYSNGDSNYNTVNVNIPVVVTAKPVEILDKFAQKMPAAQFTYRLGNGNTVDLNSIFAAVEGAEIDSASVNVSIAAQNGHAVSGTYTANTSDWTKGTLKFEGTGLVEITISDATSNPLTLTFEIVNAMNSTSAASATANNVVLLNDCGLGFITVSNGYTVFGNGFTMTRAGDQSYYTIARAYVEVNNGTLDNVRIIAPNYAHGALYLNQAKKGPIDKYDGTSPYFYCAYSAVRLEGNSKIVNSYVAGGRAAIYIQTGNAVLENVSVYGGAAANIQVGTSAKTVLMKNMNLIQEPIQTNVTYPANDHGADAFNGKTIMGLSVVVEGSDGAVPTEITLEGYLNQFAWINESYTAYAPEEASKMIEYVKKKSQYLHNTSVEGVADSKWVNLGIFFMPMETGDSVGKPVVNDNRTDKATAPYALDSIEAVGSTAYVYSMTNDRNVANEVRPEISAAESYLPTLPQIQYNKTAEGVTYEKSYSEEYGWMSTISLDLDTLGSYTLNFADLVASKYGKSLEYTVSAGSSVTIDEAGSTLYILNIQDDVDCNGPATFQYPVLVKATKTDAPAPVKVAEPGGTALLVVKSKNSDWSCAIPALEGTQIQYYNKTNKKVETLTLSSLTPQSKGKQNGTNNYWNYSDPNGNFTLKVTCGVIHDTKSVYGMPVVVNNSGNKMYFTISSTNGYVTTNTASRTVTISYEFTDGNGQTLTFSKTWQFNYTDYKSKQYSYSDFVNGTLTEAGSGSECVAPETLVTLADGSQVRVDSLTGSEQLLVWNMETGMLDSAPVMFVDSDPTADYEIIHLYFSDGTDVKVIGEHGFWDYDLNRYVYLDKDAADYIGHTFAKQNGNELTKVQLVDVVIEKEITEAWSPVTCGHLCYFVNGMLSMPGGVGGLFNIFDVNPETMTYDYEAMARDIETYGLFTYEEMNSIVELPEEMFEAAGGAFLKISMGKGNLTMDELIAMIVRYTKYF